MKETSYKFIDLFSGCGGFSYGLEMAGHKCLLGVDFNADAIQTFKLNHPLSEVFCGLPDRGAGSRLPLSRNLFFFP